MARYSIEHPVVTLVLSAVLLVGGILAYRSMGRLEDPEFTIKDALIITPYPGASAAEVEEEVTDELETAIQSLGQLKEIESKSERGLSTITATIKDEYDKHTLPQVWDELRRKVGDAQRDLPPGAGPSLVVDDYGDVYGILVAVYGDGYDYADLKKTVDFVKRELLLVKDVAKIKTWGELPEVVYVELNRDRMSQLGIAPDVIARLLQQRNLATDARRVEVGPEFVTITATDTIATAEDLGAILVSPGSAEEVYLRDIATIRRGYQDPPTQIMRYDGRLAVGMGISMVSGGNVVEMGEALKQRLQEVEFEIPLGIHAGLVSIQSDAVTTAIRGFTTSLVEAVAIVVLVLLVFMGIRSGLLIGAILLLTIAGSFIFLQPWGVALERISLGALIIALGMLVDNAIVIVDGVLVRMQRGQGAKQAAEEVVSQSAMPLLGATAIAILGFAVIGTSDDSTGEFCRSLFQVVLVSLGFSWVTAVTVTPLLCVMFLKPPETADATVDPYGGAFYMSFKRLLRTAIRWRVATMLLVGSAFAAAFWGFNFVDRSFFPPSTRPQFMLDLWLPEGTQIERTSALVSEVEPYLAKQEGVTHVTSLIGQGGPRFLLTYQPEKRDSGYAQLLVDVDVTSRMDVLQPRIEAYLADAYPGVVSYTSRFELGPGSNGKIRPRLSGSDPDLLRRLADEYLTVLHEDPAAKGIRTDWRQRVKVIEAVVAEEEANLNGITRSDITRAIAQGFQGVSVGVFRDADLLLPIVMRAEEPYRVDVASLSNLQIFSPAAHRMIPLRQVVSSFETRFEDEVIWRRDRKRTITVFADPRTGSASTVFERVRPWIEAVALPPGYAVTWGGEYEDTQNAQGPILASLPGFFAVMVLITVVLFNSLRQPLVIWAVVPLALIGVTVGLLLTRQPFGFMALLGFLSLTGMLIKNAIVLVDEINAQLPSGKPVLDVIVDSATSRLRPVAMAASTTALGMIPLLFDAFFVAMAVTITFGLMFGTVLTMVVLPTVYSFVFRVATREAGA